MKTSSTIFCLAFIFCANMPITAQAQANEQDSLALVDLYSSTNGPSWKNQDNWLTAPVSTWFGITLGESRVTAIKLGRNRLDGSIPVSLGNLENLRTLNLSHNHVSGSIPVEFGNFARMVELDLSFNRLSGGIPAELANYTNLSKLDLSNNRFTFEGMELIVQTFPFAIYDSQAVIPLHQKGKWLTASVGGTLSNNTYTWFMVGQTDSTVITGDSLFQPSQEGKYFAKVNNSVCTALTLFTDTIDYSPVLPVTIINLTAQRLGNMVKVNWTSVTEINVHNYEIQHSANSTDFITVGILPATGGGTQQIQYTFNDVKPFTGDNFYRIKSVDNDGAISYSNIALVKMPDERRTTIVYPNPARNILYMQTDGSASFSLLDQSGKVWLTKNINSNGSMNIAGMAPGIYYLKNNSNGDVQKVFISR